MAKTTTQTKSVKTHWALGVRGRDAEFPSAPIRVSEDAQAKVIDVNEARQFNFGRQDRDKLPERPSTSGGPVTYSMRKNAEKRETKDDLHFHPLGVYGKGTTFYNFPLPGSLPTPAHTPKSSPPLPAKSSVPRSNTPESMDSKPVTLNVEQGEIGMALGSPSHKPESWQQHTAPLVSNTRSPSPDNDTGTDGWDNPPLPLKHKGSKWKILGGLFGGGKKHSNPQAFYQLQPETSRQTTFEPDNVDLGEPLGIVEKKPSKPRGRGRTNSERKTEKHKPDMKRANTAPLNFEFQEINGRMQAPMPSITIDGGPMVDNIHRPMQQHVNHGGPILDVSIPSIQMERYSVMFGSVLQKPATTITSSSLLARRQATLDRLKTVNEALALKERELEEKAKLLRPRRATSPQPTKSPAFSLFPSTPSRLTVRDVSPSASGNRASPLQRSNTSPAALSPSRPSFAPQADNEMHATLMGPAPHIPVDPRAKEQTSNQRKREPKEPKVSSKQSVTSPPKAQEANRDWSPEESHLALDSPISEQREEDVYDPPPFLMKPKLEEPSWQMITPHNHYQAPPSVSGSTSSRSEGHSTSTSASSISTASTPHIVTHKHVVIQSPPAARRNRSATTSSATRPRPAEVSNSAFGFPLTSVSTPINHEEDPGREERLESAADISIARQISVSRQQRQLLIPIKKSSSSPLNKSPNPNFPSPSPLHIGRVASPLGVVAAAAESPIAGKNGSPLIRLERMNTAERLVQASANPNTPTLVVVGSGKSEVERAWGGNMAVNSPAFDGRRKESGEVRAGLAIGTPVEMGNRKSERVVVESVGGKEGGRGMVYFP